MFRIRKHNIATHYTSDLRPPTSDLRPPTSDVGPRARGRLPFLFLRLILGAVLISTATLKFYAVTHGSDIQLSRLDSPLITIVAIQMETVVGIWLLLAYPPAWAWFAALTLFSGLSFASLSMAIEGRKSCGCAGKIILNPWWVFCFDILALTALVVSRPVTFSSALRSSRAFVRGIAGAVLLLLVVTLGFLFFGKNTEQEIARLRGEWIILDPSRNQMGEGISGDYQVFSLMVRNLHSDKKVGIVGGNSTACCQIISELPISIPPGEVASVDVKLKFLGAPGSFQKLITLYTDDPGQAWINSQFFGTIVESGSR